MATRNKKAQSELATLALAKALAEGDPKAVEAALTAGADAQAFWIDGRTRLRDFAGQRGTAAASKAIKKLFAPDALKVVPSFKSDRSLWTQSFVEFVAMRGYEFSGMTKPLSGWGGTELKGLNSVKAGVKLIHNKWKRGIVDAVCKDSDDGKSSSWSIWFDADWVGDRRITGFVVRFTVDALGWTLVEEFKAAEKAGTHTDWPALASPYVGAQKDWEGKLIVFDWCEQREYGVKRLIACMRAGGSPFTKYGNGLIGDISQYEGSQETKAFMDAFRKAIGPKEGWHLRIESMLTEENIAAFLANFERSNLASSTPKAKSPKKSLKERTDIM